MAPVTGNGVSPTNTCSDVAGGGAKACNLTSVYATLKLSISFQLTKDVTNAKAKMFLEGTGGTFSELTGSTQTITLATGSTVTLETTWASVARVLDCQPIAKARRYLPVVV